MADEARDPARLSHGACSLCRDQAHPTSRLTAIVWKSARSGIALRMQICTTLDGPSGQAPPITGGREVIPTLGRTAAGDSVLVSTWIVGDTLRVNGRRTTRQRSATDWFETWSIVRWSWPSIDPLTHVAVIARPPRFHSGFCLGLQPMPRNRPVASCLDRIAWAFVLKVR